MSDKHGQSSGGERNIKKLKKAKACRVAYTLNNAQPVTSTFIGEQPLFYMDYEGGYEDELLHEDGDFGPLEQEIMDLQREMKALERFSSSFEDNGERNFQELLENGADITGIKEGEAEDRSFLLSRLRKIIGESRLGKSFLDLADYHSVAIAWSAQVPYSQYDRKSGTILINPENEFETLVLLAIKELRVHWQHRQGALINPLLFHPDEAVLVNRAQMADQAVAVIRAAWELQLSGHKKIWERIERSTMADLGHAFAREAFLDFRTINNGVACAAVFESWFLSERCQAMDRALIQTMLSDHQGYVFDLGGISKGLTPDLIAALGSLPFGKNYLASHAGTIMGDPIFTDVRDRSNANFLWFIKFERSFRETERTLQNHPDQPSRQDVRSGATHKGQDVSHEQQGSAQIITLGAEHHARWAEKALQQSKRPDRILEPGDDYSQKNASPGDNIVYLGRWSAE